MRESASPTSRSARQRLGRQGEALAAQHLLGKGYQIVARNWRCPSGELDLVACDGACLVFVEVRARRGQEMGSPEESITLAKQARLIALADAYLQEHEWAGDWRLDVVAIELDRTGRLLRIDHYENAVSG